MDNKLSVFRAEVFSKQFIKLCYLRMNRCLYLNIVNKKTVSQDTVFYVNG